MESHPSYPATIYIPAKSQQNARNFSLATVLLESNAEFVFTQERLNGTDHWIVSICDFNAREMDRILERNGINDYMSGLSMDEIADGEYDLARVCGSRMTPPHGAHTA